MDSPDTQPRPGTTKEHNTFHWNMSTPSTITATLPPHHSHYGGYSHHHSYQANSYPSLTSTSTRNSAASTRQPIPTSSKSLSQTTATMSRSRPQRQPDWNDFYRNGVPQEIIVIDDDSPQPAQQKNGSRVTNHHNQNGAKTLVEPANKKRKTGQAQETTAIRNQTSYSNTNTPHYVGSGSNTISTDRTTSLHTTAPTSLGSHGSGMSGGVYVNNQMAGQKRKRVTRQSTADEKKRREIEVVGDAYSCYVPPPDPPIKAAEVPVKLIKDVSRTKRPRRRRSSNFITDYSPSAQDR